MAVVTITAGHHSWFCCYRASIRLLRRCRVIWIVIYLFCALFCVRCWVLMKKPIERAFRPRSRSITSVICLHSCYPLSHAYGPTNDWLFLNNNWHGMHRIADIRYLSSLLCFWCKTFEKTSRLSHTSAKLLHSIRQQRRRIVASWCDAFDDIGWGSGIIDLNGMRRFYRTCVIRVWDESIPYRFIGVHARVYLKVWKCLMSWLFVMLGLLMRSLRDAKAFVLTLVLILLDSLIKFAILVLLCLSGYLTGSMILPFHLLRFLSIAPLEPTLLMFSR